MSHDDSPSPEIQRRLDEVIAAYLQAIELGVPVDREELLAQHPELAGHLRSFFAAQDQARRTSRRLVFLYILSVATIVVGVTVVIGGVLFNTAGGRAGSAGQFLAETWPGLLAIAVFVTLVIAGATAYKTAALSGGGGRVAKDLGGTQVSNDVGDPLRQRLRNVVEEMAIASGVPVPEIYVLEQERGINAFAAGYTPGDAAIAVTRGALEVLGRDELQGVIGHEFSHVLNGDMRLNIRLMGVLFGIMVVSLAGRMLLRGGRWGAISSRRSKGTGAMILIGIGLAVLGGVGVFFARVIKASVSRQREYLADASAVQFTRQSDGIANALKKIGGYSAGSYIEATDPEEVSHMLFGTGSRLAGLFATHPPLTSRIQALDPSFNESDYPAVDLRSRSVARDHASVEDARPGVASAFAGAAAAPSPNAVAASVGHPNQQHLEYASHLRSSIPDVLYDAAHSSELAYLLTIALVMDRSGKVLSRQLGLAEDRLGEQRTRLIRRFYDEIQGIGAEYRLPLLEIAFPALRRRPPPQLAYLIELAERMIQTDGDIDLYEYCFYRVLVASLAQALHPAQRKRRRRATRKPVRHAALELLHLVAQHGHEEVSSGEAAFRAGLDSFGPWARNAAYSGDKPFSHTDLDQHLDLLTALNGDGRQMLVEAVTTVVMFDRHLTVAESELLRAVCASLECPLPPILTDAAAA